MAGLFLMYRPIAKKGKYKRGQGKLLTYSCDDFQAGPALSSTGAAGFMPFQYRPRHAGKLLQTIGFKKLLLNENNSLHKAKKRVIFYI